jgi:hypothetical protein
MVHTELHHHHPWKNLKHNYKSVHTLTAQTLNNYSMLLRRLVQQLAVEHPLVIQFQLKYQFYQLCDGLEVVKDQKVLH